MDTRLLILAFGMLAGATDGAVIGSLLPAIATDAGSTVAQAGYVVFGHAIAFAIGAPVLATLFGARDRRLVLAGAVFVLGVGALVVTVAGGIALIASGRVILALGSCLYGTMATATALTLSPPERRGRAVAVMITGQTIAAVVAAPLGAWVAVTYGWRFTYVAIAVLALSSAAMIILLVPKGLTGEVRTMRERLGVLRTPGLPLALLTTLAFMMGAFMVGAYFLSITTAGMGLERAFQPVVLFGFGIGAVLGNQLGGQLVDRLGAPRTLLGLAILQIALFSLLPIVAGLPDGFVAPVYFVVMILAGLTGWGFYTGQIANLAMIAPVSVSLAVSLNATALNIGVALAAIAGGIVLEQLGAIRIPLGGAAMTAIALALLVFARWRRVR